MKKQLLIVTDLYPRFEGDMRGIFVQDFAASLLPYCDITIFNPIASGENPGVNTYNHNKIKVISYTHSKKSKNFLNKPFIYHQVLVKSTELCKKLGMFDLIHAHGSVISGSIARKTANNIPFLITEHTGPFSTISKKPILYRTAKYNLEHADVVLTVSRYLKNEIIKSGIHPRRLEITGNPVDEKLFHLACSKTRLKNILFIARFDSAKGGLNTLKVFHRLTGSYPDWSLTMIGEGEEERLIHDYVKLNKLTQRVRIKKFKPREELINEYHNAAFFILPSMHESFGLVYIEAMSCGLPVIAPEITAPKEFINRDCGLLIDPANLKQIENAMQNMMDNYMKYDSNLIRNKVIKKYGKVVFGQHINNIYNSILKCAE